MQKSCEEKEGKLQNMPKAKEDCPLEDVPWEAERNPQPSEEDVSQEAEGNLGAGLTQPSQGYKEDTRVRHLDPEEMIRGVRRVRNKFVKMHWNNHFLPYFFFFCLFVFVVVVAISWATPAHMEVPRPGVESEL
uniref:Uncharacterized protein n=1 Tax=Sus scrofa TaxID=9823 RepID=A0A4X1UCB2_PIG